MKWFWRLMCSLSIFGHKDVNDPDGDWGPYSRVCTRCGKKDFGIHDM